MKESTRDRLVRIAATFFAERGYAGVSVRDITGEAKANLGAITYYFGSKEGLFAEVVAIKMEKLAVIARQIAESKESPDKKLLAMMHNYAMQTMHEDPSLRVIFADMIGGGGKLPAAAKEGVQWRSKLFAAVVKEGIADGTFRDCDVELVSSNFFGMLAPFILIQPLLSDGGRSHVPYPKEYVDRVVNAAYDIFMNGLRAR